jgi:hypothetical protein
MSLRQRHPHRVRTSPHRWTRRDSDTPISAPRRSPDRNCLSRPAQRRVCVVPAKEGLAGLVNGIQLWHPYPSRWTRTIPCPIQLLDDLVHALMRHLQPTSGIGAVDRIAAAESGAGKECIESLTVLSRYRFNILSDRVEQRELRLCIDGVSKTGPVPPQEPAINSRSGSRYLVDGVVTLREEQDESWVSTPDMLCPRL